ncbi:hypothetical protein F5878DRAFT_666727 [Lentinula raphanica]|uniref:Uncharacterized protein n=1 Tax=Lentinula raphanica TaxID=153919 RepID=A0AA38NX56_9AGAR|nr:hypothetical protein F5878DRAFT_666727 [Lentinula raphanica]
MLPVEELSQPCNGVVVAQIVYNMLQPYVLQHGNSPPSQFISGFLASNELRLTELALRQDENLVQGTRIWWHARYATHAGIYSSMRELVNTVDNSNPNFRHAFGFASFSQALYSALTFDSNPPGLLYDYNPANRDTADDIRRTLYPHGIMSVTLPLPMPTQPAPPYSPRAPTPPTADDSAAVATADAPAVVMPAVSSTSAGGSGTTAAEGSTVRATTTAGGSGSTAAEGSTARATSPATPIAQATTPVTPTRGSTTSPRPQTPEFAYASLSQVYEMRGSRSPAPASGGGGVVIYSPSVNISYGDSPSKPPSKSKSKSKSKGSSNNKGKGKAHSSDGSDGDESTFTGIGGLLWVRHYFLCQGWDPESIDGVVHMLMTAVDADDFVQTIDDLLDEGVARFVYELYMGSFNV